MRRPALLLRVIAMMDEFIAGTALLSKVKKNKKQNKKKKKK